MTEHIKPETLLERELGGLVVEVGTHQAVACHLVRQFEDRMTMIDANTRSLVFSKCFLGCPAQRGRCQCHVVVTLLHTCTHHFELAETCLVFAT